MSCPRWLGASGTHSSTGSRSLARSITGLPARLRAPANARAASEFPPLVALTTTSPNVAASSKDPVSMPSSSAKAFRLAESRDLAPTITAYPTAANRRASVCPTWPVPRTPILFTSIATVASRVAGRAPSYAV